MSLFLFDLIFCKTPMEVKTKNKIVSNKKKKIFMTEYNELMQKPAPSASLVLTNTAVSGGNITKYSSVKSAENKP